MLTITLNEPYPYYSWISEYSLGSPSPIFGQPVESAMPTPCPGSTSWNCADATVASTYFLQEQGDYTVKWVLEMLLPVSSPQPTFVPEGQPCAAHLSVPPPTQQDGCTIATLIIHVTVSGTPSPSATLTFTGGTG